MAQIKFYPYRKARVYGDSIKASPEIFNLFLGSLCEKVTQKWEEGEFASVNGVSPDNHVCFEVNGAYVMFSDYEIIVGEQMEVGPW